MSGSNCVVCGSVCGPLAGVAKSWVCAGRLSHSTKQAHRLGTVMANDGKDGIRDAMVARALELNAHRVLDLFGSGESARRFAAAGIEVVSAESDKRLWPALRADAASHGYTPHCGEVENAPGVFDFVWLDFCGQISDGIERTLILVAQRRMSPGAHLAVTLLPERESYGLVSHGRAGATAAALVATVRRNIVSVATYRRPNGHQMAVYEFAGEPRPIDAVAIAESVMATGRWAASTTYAERIGRRTVAKGISAANADALIEYDQVMARQEKRVCLDGLDDETREVVAAIIHARQGEDLYSQGIANARSIDQLRAVMRSEQRCMTINELAIATGLLPDTVEKTLKRHDDVFEVSKRGRNSWWQLRGFRSRMFKELSDAIATAERHRLERESGAVA